MTHPPWSRPASRSHPKARPWTPVQPPRWRRVRPKQRAPPGRHPPKRTTCQTKQHAPTGTTPTEAGHSAGAAGPTGLAPAEAGDLPSETAYPSGAAPVATGRPAEQPPPSGPAPTEADNDPLGAACPSGWHLPEQAASPYGAPRPVGSVPPRWTFPPEQHTPPERHPPRRATFPSRRLVARANPPTEPRSATPAEPGRVRSLSRSGGLRAARHRRGDGPCPPLTAGLLRAADRPQEYSFSRTHGRSPTSDTRRPAEHIQEDARPGEHIGAERDTDTDQTPPRQRSIGAAWSEDPTSHVRRTSTTTPGGGGANTSVP